MPELPAVPGQRVVRALRRQASLWFGLLASHYELRHSDGRGTMVPVHRGRDVAKGTLCSILADTEDQ